MTKKKTARTLARERVEALGEHLAVLVMRLYVKHARYDHRADKDTIDVHDFSCGTWEKVAQGLLDVGWTPPAAWEPPPEARKEDLQE